MGGARSQSPEDQECVVANAEVCGVEDGEVLLHHLGHGLARSGQDAPGLPVGGG